MRHHTSWTRFSPSKATIPVALLTAVLCTAGMLAVWVHNPQPDVEMNRFGNALAQTVAASSAGHLLHKDRLEMAVVAQDTLELAEVGGVIFFNPNNEIVAVSGASDAGRHFTAPATLDDTITGYVTVVMIDEAFTPVSGWWRWLVSVVVLLGAPAAAIATFQLTARGNRSIPIVSVPDPMLHEQPSYCVAINLYNQLALDKKQISQTVGDALEMAKEVCAVYPGIAVELPNRGVLMFMDKSAVAGSDAVAGAFLALKLLTEYETAGQFRSFVCVRKCPGAPADLAELKVNQLPDDTDIEGLLTMAALAKPETVLLDRDVFHDLDPMVQVEASVFEHPLLDDMTDGDTYQIGHLPEKTSSHVEGQAQLILGFNQASA